MNIRPLTGHIYVQKYNPDQQLVNIDNVGVVNIRQITESGLVWVSNDSKEASDVRAELYVIESVGPNPRKWTQRYFSSEFNWDTDWVEQRIQVGTIVSARACAGMVSKLDHFVQLRYDEICAIGVPVDSDEDIDMRPAPGWVMVEIIEPEYSGSLIAEVAEDWCLRAKVVGLPIGYNLPDLVLGSVVGIPVYTQATEYVDFQDNLRALPMEDVLCVFDDYQSC